MLLYIDSLLGEGGARDAKPLHTIPDTLTRLYLLAMREHDRPGVFLQGSGDRWQAMPDWRFDRRVIRTALYARERLDVDAGQRVAIVSELRPEWFLVDFAAAGLGAVSVAVPPDLPADRLAATLEDACPNAVFFSGLVAKKLSVVGGAPDARSWFCFDGGASSTAIDFEKLVELGGTLDTPERAQLFRATAAEAQPDEPAIRHYRSSADACPTHVDLTHREVLERLEDNWAANPPRPGDRVYVSASALSLDLRLLLYAYVGDGHTTVALGNANAEVGEITTLRPHGIVVSSEAIEKLMDDHGAPSNRQGQPEPLSGWRRLAARLTRASRPDSEQQAVVEALGGRARWVAPTTPLDPALAARLGSAVSLGTVDARAAQPAQAGEDRVAGLERFGS